MVLSSLIRIFLLLEKILTLRKTQIDLVFHSLIRIFAAENVME